MIASTGSGRGKTTFVTGLLEVLKDREVHAFKCGPDYIDPMFHKEVLGIPSTNLDPFFCDDKLLNYVFDRNKGDINIIEAAMGLYDGIGTSSRASAYDVAAELKCNIILLVDGSGMGYSIIPLIKGFLLDDKYGLIKGIVINRISKKYYEKIAPVIESETGVKVFGFIPKIKGAELSSRYLGLLLPHENDFKNKLEIIKNQICESVDVNGIISEGYFDDNDTEKTDAELIKVTQDRLLNISVARDEAFIFSYMENIKFLERIGSNITYFSPLHDMKIPDNSDCIIFYGGYPENYARELSGNREMIISIRNAYEKGVKIIAECGGFMYLLNSLHMNDSKYDMVGIINGYSYRTNGLVRFGYVNVNDCGKTIKAHEFHHFDTADVEYTKEVIVQNEGSKDEYLGMIKSDKLLAGFPHLYYLSNPELISEFLGAGYE